MVKSVFIHDTAEVDSTTKIGSGTKIWHQAQVREEAEIGKSCVLGKGVYIDKGVILGDYVRVQNYACIYDGVVIERGGFIGTDVVFATDLNPRSLSTRGIPMTTNDWSPKPILVRRNASIGSSAVILGGVTIGRFALVGAGSVVTNNVCDHGLVYGNPAKLVGFVCKCGNKLKLLQDKGMKVLMICPKCLLKLPIPKYIWKKVSSANDL